MAMAPQDIVSSQQTETPSTSPIPSDIDAPLCDPGATPDTSDPPPPYPSRARRSRRARRLVIHDQQTPHAQIQIPSTESYSDHDEDYTPSSPRRPHVSYTDAAEHEHEHDDDDDATEATPFLLNSNSSPTHRTTRTGRPRALSSVSQASSTAPSAAPSLRQTCLSILYTDDEDSNDGWDDGNGEGRTDVRSFLLQEEDGEEPEGRRRGRRRSLFSADSWRRYFRPMGKWKYYRSLVHLLLVNFPYALAAWVYLFVFTVAGTTLLVALPLGAVLCFVGLLGARAFARGELALQTRFHSPLSYPAPYPPRPIFTRMREATPAELESGVAAAPGDLIPERSFYRNAYALFTDPTSYQALFYFLVIKPSTTLILLLLIIVVGIPAFLLVLPAPAMLRAVRRLGVWQANVAVEGLYLAVR